MRPFTSALLKDLTVPGRDIHIAFGCGRRHEGDQRTPGPFVYGSLGGGAIRWCHHRRRARSRWSPTPRPTSNWSSRSTHARRGKFTSTQNRPLRRPRAWHTRRPATRRAGHVGQNHLAASRPAARPKALDWDKLRIRPTRTLQNFIKRYPDSPLAITAQDRINTLIKAAGPRRAATPCQGTEQPNSQQRATRRRAQSEGGRSAAEGEGRRSNTTGRGGQGQGRCGAAQLAAAGRQNCARKRSRSRPRSRRQKCRSPQRQKPPASGR